MAQPPVSSSQSQEQRVQEFVSAHRALRAEIGKVIVGHDEVVDEVLVGLVAGGTCCSKACPGSARPLLIKTLAEVLDLDFSRIQFTPDLMPADIIGTNVLVRGRGRREHGFRFQRGPVFAQHRARRRDQPRHARRPSPRCSRRCRSSAVTVGGHHAPAGGAVLRARHAEPHRDGGHLPAARGAARPLPLQAAGCGTRRWRRWRRSSSAPPAGDAPGSKVGDGAEVIAMRDAGA